ALLEQLALLFVGFLGGILRDGASLLGEFQIWIPAAVGRLHGGVARQRCRDSELLLAPVDVGDSVAGRWLNEAAQPHGRPEDEPGIAGLVAPGLRAERR